MLFLALKFSNPASLTTMRLGRKTLYRLLQ